MPDVSLGCVHEWAEENRKHPLDRHGGYGDSKQPSNRGTTNTEKTVQGAYCIHCGGWRGGLGSEPAPEMFIGHLILVMKEMYRVLRDDGVAFINLGDSYNSNASNQQNGAVDGPYQESAFRAQGRRNKMVSTLKPKDLCLIPYRFALAAQADGWTVRSDLIWHKRAPMPESVTDRCTKAHEYIYMLSKREKYFYDAEAIKENNSEKKSLRRNLQTRS